MTRFFCIIFLW